MMAVQNILDTRVQDNVSILLEPDRLPRLKLAGRNLRLSTLSEEWSRRPTRMVILGEPGAGKTVVALVLVAAVIESADDESAPIAELFPLAEWSRWQVEHPSHPFSHWLAYHLATTYQLPSPVCQELIDRDLVIPVLDGLDEVPEGFREHCRTVIDVYATQVVPPRVFLISCRAVEYLSLDPHWAASDQVVVVHSLDTAQVLAALTAEGRNAGGWLKIQNALASGNRNLRELFQSPLRLTIALKSYADADPSELLTLPLDKAKARLWDHFLATGYDGQVDYAPRDVHRWLTWLATQMTRQNRQLFWIHELYRYAPSRPREFRRFRSVLGQLAIGLVGASVVLTALAIRADDADVLRVLATLGTIHVIGELVFRRTGLPIARRALSLTSPEEPVERLIISWRLNFQAGRRAMTFITIGLFACWWALAGAVAAGLRGVIVGLPIGAVMAVITKLLIPASAVVSFAPDKTVLTQRDILRESARAGVVAGARGAIGSGIAALTTGFLVRWSGGHHLATDLIWLYFVAAALGAGLAFGLGGGLDAWAYHRWLSRYLAKRGYLPKHLDRFLEWSSQPSRTWIRVVGPSYQFRHRELQDHLAGSFSNLE